VSVSPESRSPAFLAALASAAVPGLDPVSARAVTPGPAGEFDAAIVIDEQDRPWFVRCPRTPAAGARLETAASLVALLARRLPFQVPVPKGFASLPDGRAAVYPMLAGRPLAFDALPAGPGLAADLGRTIAAIHNVDRGVYDEAGVPSYDADSYRTRHLADLDRAAATGHVPTALLSRWEEALDDVTLWRFAPAPVHGGLTGAQVLAVFDSDDDASSGRVRAVVGWEDAKIADPAEDFAALVTAASPTAVESVLEAYANSRIDRPDPHLRRRARLAFELGLLTDVLAAVTLGDPDRVRATARRLGELARSAKANDLRAPEPVSVVPREVVLPAQPSGAGTAGAGTAGAGTAGTAGSRGRDGSSSGQDTVAVDPGTLFDDTVDDDSAVVAANPGHSDATDEDTVAMDPRTLFDATEEIPTSHPQPPQSQHE
jgi:aminoglycoside phosphotransferase (APT) family kinase protein